MSAIVTAYSNVRETLQSKAGQAQTCLSGKYRSFVDWTAENSLDVRNKLAVEETNCIISKIAKVALTVIASLILFIPALMVSACCSSKNFICEKIGKCKSPEADQASAQAPLAEDPSQKSSGYSFWGV